MTSPGANVSAAQRLRGGAVIAVAIGVMNLTTYAFTVLAARHLEPQSFGALTALLNVTLVAGVLSLALQATAARRIAREPHHVDQVERVILQVGRWSALGLGTFFLIISPAVDAVLRLNSLGTAMMLAVAVAPITMMGAQAGVLQGERRWVPLAMIYLAAGVPRLVLGVLLLAWRPEESIAFLAVTVSAFAPLIVGSIALRRRSGHEKTPGDHTARELWWETVYNSQALLAFLALASLDIVVARNTLSPGEAGLYAAGLVMTKAVTFMPQFVVVLAFPSMGTDESARSTLLISLAAVAVTGLGITAAVHLLQDPALAFVGGDKYAEIGGQLWIFAALGTLVSMVQLLVYSVLARPTRASVTLLWGGLAALLVAGSGASSVTELINRVLLVDGALFVAMLTVSLRRLRRHSAALPEDP